MNIKRIEKLISSLNENGKTWDAAFIFSKVNQYYFTGTMQDGILVVTPSGKYGYFVRKSFSRALFEINPEEHNKVHKMPRYSVIADILGGEFSDIYLETSTVTFAITERLKKYFPIKNIMGIEPFTSALRAEKDAAELDIMRKSGMLHKQLMEEVIPAILREGMDETELCSDLFSAMLKLGYHGVSRFGMFQNETVIGQLGFGENSVYPTYFDGPGGMKGMSAAVPIIGDRNRKLRRGDLVFIDIGFGIDGYHTDKTQIYSFGIPQSDTVITTHKACIEIQSKTAGLLKAGAIPSEIYNNVMSGMPAGFTENFMGMGDDAVKFLGHGTGLQIDEYPVIAKGFNEPLKAGTVIAIEPKKCIPETGIVGVEDTYIVTETGAECITGGGRDIIVVSP